MTSSTPAPEPGSGGSVPKFRVASVIRKVSGALLRDDPLTPGQARLLRRIAVCRTPALGGEFLVCFDCGFVKEVFHSCRDRHCPNCQAQAQDEWIASRAASMLPVPHFHVVFTLPSELRGLATYHPRAIYDLLLRTSGEVLITLGMDKLNAQFGVTAVLHTWTRDLSYHPHAHCIVSAGGWDAQTGRFVHLRHNGYLFPAARMRAMFRARFLRGLRGLVQQGVVRLPGEVSFREFEATLPPKGKWVVYAQAPFGKFEHVLSYLGRYTHRVGISDSRIHDVTDDEVTFATKDGKTCTLDHEEFTRRFLRHTLPDGFKKIRHFGLYASGSKQRTRAQEALAAEQAAEVHGDEDTPVVVIGGEPDTHAVWEQRCCPDCKIPLTVAAHFPRPARPPWKPP
jgi:hypothetical protein